MVLVREQFRVTSRKEAAFVPISKIEAIETTKLQRIEAPSAHFARNFEPDVRDYADTRMLARLEELGSVSPPFVTHLNVFVFDVRDHVTWSKRGEHSEAGYSWRCLWLVD